MAFRSRFYHLFLVPTVIGAVLVVYAYFQHREDLLDPGLFLFYTGVIFWTVSRQVLRRRALTKVQWTESGRLRFREGSRVRIADRVTLEGLRQKWRLEARLTDAQLACAGTVATVEEVTPAIWTRAFFYRLAGLPGLWREQYLRPGDVSGAT